MKHLVLIAALFTISSVYASPHRQTQPQQFQQQRSKTPQRFRKSFKSPEIKKLPISSLKGILNQETKRSSLRESLRPLTFYGHRILAWVIR